MAFDIPAMSFGYYSGINPMGGQNSMGLQVNPTNSANGSPAGFSYFNNSTSSSPFAMGMGRYSSMGGMQRSPYGGGIFGWGQVWAGAAAVGDIASNFRGVDLGDPNSVQGLISYNLARGEMMQQMREAQRAANEPPKVASNDKKEEETKEA